MGVVGVTSFLLDTNALLWLVTDPDRISDDVRTTLADQGNELVVSAASAWEIAIKTRIGRLDGETLLSTWAETLTAMNATDLAIDSADASAAGRLDWNHHDPFDRMIVAQALRRQLTIVTSDRTVIDGALTPTLDTRA
ncbi:MULTISPECIES: type II toxin-antitoxin system VapC family toxin [Nocardiaceae]|uniref:Type II toxin-antitoxin system VapC family toxin n=1 Tax=Rhodococcoides yunnanense TaxID=278209 RepID=A0ABU4B771_9NOCA|nr:MULTISPECIES: type II toxin-antitoxin system VapC family toxin [Rhodococcus]MDI9894264.1 type II toxin-antitoxin system VapC family toxin [Rhodococcus sp. IEGM 1381]MDV6260004.1 type II toxin-antitoxin system VapC family toxin [Rhodococcus yunnanensis]